MRAVTGGVRQKEQTKRKGGGFEKYIRLRLRERETHRKKCIQAKLTINKNKNHRLSCSLAFSLDTITAL